MELAQNHGRAAPLRTCEGLIELVETKNYLNINMLTATRNAIRKQ